MVKTWRGFRALNTGDRYLAMEAAVCLICAWVGLRVCSVPTLRSLSGDPAASGSGHPVGLSIDAMRRVAWAVRAASRQLPVKTTCLVEALAADAMLRRRGCACELRFGVRPPGKRDAADKTLAAHAWIEHDGIVMLGELENLSDYTVLSAPGGM